MIIRALLLLLVTTTALAQPRWEFIETWGSKVYTLLVMPDSTLVADTEIGIVTSSNRGEEWTLSWKHQPHSTPGRKIRMNLVAVSPKTGTLIADTQDSLYFSTDGGRVWTSAQVASNDLIRFLRDVTVTRNGIFYLSHYVFQENKSVGGLLRSDDDGRTWSRVGFPEIYADRILALDEQSLIAVTGDSLDIIRYKGKRELRISTDRGISWSEGKPCPWPHESRISRPIDLQLDSTGALWALTWNGVWKSTDTGTSWTPHLNNLTDNLVSMTVTPDGEIFVGVINGDIWRSNNSGATWLHTAPTPSHRGRWGYRLVALPGGDLFRLHFTSTGILYSSDTGRTWTRRNNGIPPIVGTLGAGGGRIVARLDQETRISNDGGKSWQFHQYPRHGSQWSTVTNAGTVLISSDSILERSTDGGITWTRTDGLPPFSDFVDNGVGDLFALDRKSNPPRYCISQDDGITWNCLPPDPLLASTRVAVFDGRHAAYVPASPGIRVSLDNGTTWIPSREEYPFALTVAHDGSVIAMTHSGVIRSDDRGKTWLVVTEPSTLYFTSMVTAPDGSIIGGTQGEGIWLSVNRGESWMPFSNGLTHDYISALAVDRSTGVVYAGTEFGGLFKLVDAGWPTLPADK